ncbi:hypothetical protein UFOVP240_38 [uncultured Caudovirales phage]|uniref:Uncharacterized protein n=1 Tax=uncultured Caudovirales phage TaxID=2100421 RepID=A0A6J7X0P0_9CAUD|nr:hypothetical protein UFOVP240_38 [uncultured Caudovirales phage]
MNERIEKLIEQCTVQNFSDCTGGFETFDKEKFAELIVQECVNIVEGISPGYEDYRNQIEDAFRRDAISEMKSILSGEEKCWCHTCRPIDARDPESISMRLCPSCGNKRCPKATDHRNECTNSNEPNQEGSIY